MMSNIVKLIIAGSKPEEIAKCTLLAVKIRKYVERLTDVQVLFTLGIEGFSSITIEDKISIECDDDDEILEKAINEIARIITKRKFVDIAIAAATYHGDLL
jgi:hypothetical protein